MTLSAKLPWVWAKPRPCESWLRGRLKRINDVRIYWLIIWPWCSLMEIQSDLISANFGLRRLSGHKIQSSYKILKRNSLTSRVCMYYVLTNTTKSPRSRKLIVTENHFPFDYRGSTTRWTRYSPPFLIPLQDKRPRPNKKIGQNLEASARETIQAIETR